jgi:hypothetical protein
MNSLAKAQKNRQPEKLPIDNSQEVRVEALAAGP